MKIGKSGGWKSSIGGTNYKSSGGKVNMLGTSKGKGTVGDLPSSSEKKTGQSNYLGSGGDKGIPKKSGGGGGFSSKQAAAHDDADA